MYRILAAEHELKDRRNLREKTIYERPELLATGPKQLWSWDITKLRGPAKGIYYQLYVVLDVFSRYVVGWLLAARESTELAIHLLSTSHENQGVVPGTLTVHADRGSSMMSTGVASLLERLDVSKSHSRPSISDDNPYSESQFKTMKYRPEYPDRFGSFEDALQFCRGFFKWYHEEHYHSGLCWLTPATVHYGGGPAVLAARHQTLMKAYEHNPRLFINGAPKMAVLPARVWINAPFHEKSISEEQESSSTQEVTSDYTESHSQV
jgi:putative transposase